jgi:uridine kinase
MDSGESNLILVEGMSGSGKSTTCQWLHQTLSVPTAWYP